MTESADLKLRWLDPSKPENRSANRETAKALGAMIDGGHRKAVTDIVEQWAPSAVLDCFATLKPKRAQKLLKWVSDDHSLRLLTEVDPDFRHVLFEEDTKAKFAKVLKRKDRHGAARFLLSLPAEYAELIVDVHPEALYLRELLADADSAQAAMKRGAVVARESGTIGDVIEDIRTREAQIPKIDSLHIVDDLGHLTGFLKLRDLILNPPETPISDVARRDPLTVTRDTDREEVLKLAEARDESIIAVVNGDGKLLGVIAPTELTEIARREAEEDMLLMSGVSPDSTAFDSPVQILRRRLPWLATGLIGSAVAATVIGSFEDTLAAAAILASFIPVVMATAGNAGMQAASVSLQEIASVPEDARFAAALPGRVMRELSGAFLNGGVLGSAVGLIVLAVSLVFPIDRSFWLGATVAISMTCVVLIASLMGTVMPFALRALGRDPAAATGIFILGANDVFGVLIYFTVATLLYF
ncbi:MAG: magnesium transporter [Pseudomonadota bacterium]